MAEPKKPRVTRNAKQEIEKVKKKETAMTELVPVDEIPEELRQEIINLTGNENIWDDQPVTRYQLKRLQASRMSFRGGYYKTSIMICSDKCMVKERCPLVAISQMPVGRDCPVEEHLIETYIDDYATAIAGRQSTDKETLMSDMIVRNLIGELATSHIIENRLNTKMAKDGMIERIYVGGAENGGAAHFREEETIPSKKLEQIKKRRDIVYRQLLATPEMELKKKAIGRDASSKAGEVLDKANEILKAAGIKTIDVTADSKVEDG